MGSGSDRVGRTGIYGVALLITHKLGWKFREQHESDWGIDAIIEIADDDVPTGRYIALQIKAGYSRVAKMRHAAQWTLYGQKRHLSYWIESSIPVLVVLYDPAQHAAYWQHVNDQTATWTGAGFKINVPETRPLDASAGVALRTVADEWVPRRGTALSRSLRAIATCNAAGVPVPPTEQFWETVVHDEGRSPVAGTPPVQTLCLPLTGDAPATKLTARDHGGLARLQLNDLRGLWSVPYGTTVFVCENPIVIDAAASTLGLRSRPVVALGGLPSLAVEYLLLGLGACGADLQVHVDHDAGGNVITDTLFARNVKYQPWCPGGSTHDPHYEEECLPNMLKVLAKPPEAVGVV